jgi:shikimate dehydrogenase
VINAGVLGSPIIHSLSPLLHQTAYTFLGIQGEYKAYEVPSGGLVEFLSDQGQELNCLSLTMPLKEEALSIADHVSTISEQIASGNTLHKKDDGWHLTSTDVEGFSFALAAVGDKSYEKVLIIGAGATARAVAAACNTSDTSLTVIGRSENRFDSIQKSAPDASINFVDWSSQLNFDTYDLVVNTTPANTAGVFLNSVRSPQGVFFEVIYNPWPTDLLKKWSSSGGSYVDGLDLLIHQAISQIEIFTGQKVDRTSMAALLRNEGERALR